MVRVQMGLLVRVLLRSQMGRAEMDAYNKAD
jgi:hypothetical protein